ncbi:MAG: 4-hydroxy-tetrahydrodipicolinate reductase [Haloferacaceae archaeon]
MSGAEPLRVAVTGAGGRMGREVLTLASTRDDLAVAVAVNRSPVTDVSGVSVRTVDGETDLAELLSTTEPDVLVDFTAPEVTAEYVAACSRTGVPAVVGTTGFDDGHRRAIERASESVPVLVAANFSRGVLALRRAIREAVRALPTYDVELTETHHNGKRDAPSGTAGRILEDVEGVLGDDGGDGPDHPRVHGREGDQPREPGEIGVHARRAGDVTGEHELLLAGNRETLELTHRAGDRGVFAAGALDAAAWLAGRDPGLYEFADAVDGEATRGEDDSTENDRREEVE